jgi:hypothetical protein
MPGDRGAEAARLVPVPDGRGYRIDSPPAESMVTPDLAAELRRVLELFASRAGFGEDRPVGVLFKHGIFGHHRVGRAADIYGVGGIGLGRWKAQWNQALVRAAGALDGAEGERIVNAERTSNLGFQLHRTMAAEGRWSQPYGYPVQLFGPWSRNVGPWKYISDRLLHAHRDHIHVAK